MVRLLTTTALVAVISTSAFASPASDLRDTLNGVYESFDGNFADINGANLNSYFGADGTEKYTNDGAAHKAYAQLLDDIDNRFVEAELGDEITTPLFDSNNRMVDPATIPTPTFGNVAYEKPIDVQPFIDAVTHDLFAMDAEGNGIGIISGEVDALVDRLNDYNEAATDINATPQEREALYGEFITYFEHIQPKYNSALDALDTVNAVADNYANYAIGGHEGYASYTDWVIDNPLPTDALYNYDSNTGIVYNAAGTDIGDVRSNGSGEFYGVVLGDLGAPVPGPWPTAEEAAQALANYVADNP